MIYRTAADLAALAAWLASVDAAEWQARTAAVIVARDAAIVWG